MKTIKFRGLRTDGKGWIYGSLAYFFNQKENTMIMPNCYFGSRDFGEEDENENPIISDEIILGGFLKVLPESVGQFTGLLDKNGKEIYEGDVLDSSESIPMIFEVYYQDGGFRYGKKDRSVDLSFSGHNWLENILKRFHIIGNIHENENLLND